VSHKPPPVVQVDYEELKQMTPAAVNRLREAFMGPKAYGAIAVRGIPDYGKKRRRMYRSGIDLALKDADGRKKAAAVNNTYPGWSGVPGSETHPLQSSFLFNAKEEVSRPDGKSPNGVNPYFGKNVFPSEDFRESFVGLADPMHDAALHVLKGCDVLVEVAMGIEGREWTTDNRSLYNLALEGPALAGRFICYDSAFTREDTLLDKRDEADVEADQRQEHASIPPEGMQKTAGHASDGLASMRTHSTPVKTAGHAGDGLASMRTHSTPVKSAGHAGDGLASMRTHSTPVKSAGHAGDGLASMRTHSTPVKSAGHAGDGLASMRTHSTPVKSAGHAGDGLASMRTHSTPVKSAGHAGDGLASMRTHSTPVKSAGHAGDGLASMRTHSTPVKSAGHAGDGLASMRTHSTPVKSTGHVAPSVSTAFKSTHIQPTGGNEQSSVRAQSSVATVSDGTISDPPISPTMVSDSASKSKDLGDYWLPWHIDSNFVTIIHKEMYAYEKDGSFAPEPEGAGVVFMNEVGDITTLETDDPDIMILQMGAFAQIYAGGHVAACRHAVISTAPTGIARFNYCNFWYIPWETACIPPPGREHLAVNQGWNAMMDESYIGITMKEGFTAFRKFMTSPEARLQFQDSVQFKELSELLPLPAKTTSLAETKAATTRGSQIVIDVLTDLRCPISYISLLNLNQALQNLGMSDSTTIRYHPVFLNPNIPKEGEALDDYLLREFGYSKEYARSDDYPLRLMGLEAGVDFSPDRRVVNTFDAACLVEVAQEAGKQRELVELLSRRYFEDAKDISDVNVLCDLGEAVGLDRSELQRRLQEVDGPLQSKVRSAYKDFSENIGEVPHFLLRDRVSGNGVDAGGRRSVEDWESQLQTAVAKGSLVGMPIAGLDGGELWLEEANPTSPISMCIGAQHQWVPEAWPYTEQDFSRMDETSDSSMYAEPRFVNHLDDATLARLTNVYRSAFAAAPDNFAVLDMCSSWVSHFPKDMPDGARVAVHGLNERELAANMQATERHVQNLNENPRLPYEDGSFDFVTNALSVQYLTDPRAVFSEMHRVLRPGGMAIVAMSHRCFIEKAVNIWAKETYDGEGHAHTVCRYFQHGPVGGWTNLSSVDVSPSHGDPMWLVTAIKA
jgi:predicted DsbA family dithiol-disulfide isomerase